MKSHELLKLIIENKKNTNRYLSLRSIALKVGISSGRLSEILNGKRRLTEYYLEKICSSMNLSPEENETLRKAHSAETNSSEYTKNFNNFLKRSQIESLVDWRVYGLMSFFQTTTYLKMTESFSIKSQQIEWMADKMDTSPVKLTSILTSMEALNLIQWTGSAWEPLSPDATTGYDIPNKFIQEAHARDLELAKEKLFQLDVSERDFSSMTLAMDSKDIVKAKKMIRDFRREFTNLLEQGSKKNVYQISIQFFPLFDLKDQ